MLLYKYKMSYKKFITHIDKSYFCVKRNMILRKIYKLVAHINDGFIINNNFMI